MNRAKYFSLLMISLLSVALAACREKAAQNNAQPSSTAANQSAPQNAPQNAAVAGVTPQVLASPVDPKKPFTLPAQGGNNSLDAIPERLRRPLTLDEINALPPETRDMILRAQGRLPAAPAKK